MSLESPISILIAQWEQLRADGAKVDLEQLCSDHPDCLEELRGRVRVLESINGRLFSGATADHTGDSLCDGEFTVVQESGSLPGDSVETQTRYRILRSHARGGLGEVLVAEDASLRRLVALKVIRQPHDRDPGRRLRFTREAEITGRLDHPGIVPVHGIGTDRSGRPCYTMRFVDGETLHEAIRRYHDLPGDGQSRERKLALRQLLQNFVSVCNTVAFAHSHQVIHRDLKPANILVGRFGETLVVDWGLAKQLGEGTRSDEACLAVAQPGSPRENGGGDEGPLTQQNGVLGTPAFMSPEQALGCSDLTTACDIWGLGATLFAILTGRPPIPTSDLGQMLEAVRSADFPRPREVRPGVAPALEAVCLKAMSRNPEDRYSSALLLAADLEHWLADEPVLAFREPLWNRCQRWMRHHRLLMTSLSAAAAVAIVALLVLLWVSSRSNEKLRDANQKESQAKQLADRNAILASTKAALAEEQSELALSVLQTVIIDIQSQLKNIPSAHPVRKRLLEKSMAGLKQVAASLQQRPRVDRNLYKAHLDLGDIFLEVGDESGIGGTVAALDQFRLAFGIARQLADSSAAPDFQRDLAVAHRRMGTVCRELSTVAEARGHFEKAVLICLPLSEADPENTPLQRETAFALDDLGNLLFRSGSLDEAASRYGQSLKIREANFRREPDDPNSSRDLQVSHDKTGIVALRRGNNDEAIAAFQKALALAQTSFDADPLDPARQRDLAYLNGQIGYCHWKNGDFAQVQPWYARSLELYQQRYDLDPGNLKAERDLMQAHESMGALMRKTESPEAARSHFAEMMKHCERLVALDPQNQTAQRDLSVACEKTADLMEALGLHEDCLVYRRRDLESSRALADLDPTDPRGQIGVALGLSQLAASLLEMNRPSEAVPLLEEAVELYRPHWEASRSDRSAWREFLVLQLQLGAAYRQTSELDRARTLYQSALALAESLLAVDPKNASVQLDLVTLFHSQGVLEMGSGDRKAARRCFEKALQIIAGLELEKRLVGDDLTWRKFLEDAIRQTEQTDAGGL